MLITEVRIKGESEHTVVPHEELGRLLERDQVEGVFKFGLVDRAEPPDEQVKATFNLVHKGLRKGRPTDSAFITTVAQDRDGDIVRSAGLEVTSFLQNPLVLANHKVNADVYPVSLAEKLKQTAKSWWAAWQWLVDVEATKERAQKFMEMWRAMILNATSIGFLPSEWKEIEEAGWDFVKSELLEFSLAFIPSNREALRTDGVKQFLQSYGELVTAGPSPIAKSFFEQGMAAIQPKQVSLGKATVDLELTAALKDRDGDEALLVKIEDEPGAVQTRDSVLVAPGSFTEIERDVRDALGVIEESEERWVWIEVLYAERVIYGQYERGVHQDLYFERTYTRDVGEVGPRVVFGPKKELDRITEFVPHGDEKDAKALPGIGVVSGLARIFGELEERAAAAEQRAEEWRTAAVLLAADVITIGGERDGE